MSTQSVDLGVGPWTVGAGRGPPVRSDRRGDGVGSRSYARRMARFFDVHPVDPQPRLVSQVVGMLRDDDALIAYPTDSCYALGARIDNHDATDRIRQIRQLDDRHHFTLVCADFAQL